MKVKKETIILALVIVASAVYLVAKKQDGAMYDLPSLAPVKADAIDHIRISRSGKTVDLEKKGDRWVITPQGFPADGARVKGMLFSLEDMAITALISESRAYERYDLGETQRIHVMAWAGGKLKRDVDVGKEAATYQHTHVRLPDDPRIYLARGDFRRQFDKSLDDLRDKRVMHFQIDDITALTVEQGGKSFSYTAQKPSPSGDKAKAAETTWQGDGGTAANSDIIKRLLTTLSRLECKTFITSDSETTSPPGHIVIRLTGEKAHDLRIGVPTAGGDKSVPGISSDIPYPFELTAWEVENLAKTIGELTGQAPPEERGASSSSG